MKYKHMESGSCTKCPYCGSDDVDFYDLTEDGAWEIIKCDACGRMWKC